MKRTDLEHILRECKGTTGQTEFIVIGSQAILGQFPRAPRVFRFSMDADLYPTFRPDLAARIEVSLGRYSPFDQIFGYHADGVGPTTATLPAGWEDRMVKVCNANTGGAVGWCLDSHDIAYSKLAARREKDLAFVTELMGHKMVRPVVMQGLIEGTNLEALRRWLEEGWEICKLRVEG